MTTNPRYANGARRRAVRARVLARDDNCWLCGKPVDKSIKTPDPWSPEVHELIPVSRGGSPYQLSNLTLTHRTHNRWISDRTPDEVAEALRSPTQRRNMNGPLETSQEW